MNNTMLINWDNVLNATKGDEFLSIAEICKKLGYQEEICLGDNYKDISALIGVLYRQGHIKRIKSPGRIAYLYNARDVA